MPEPAHKRHDCVGVSYYTYWMRSTGQAPVCIGFSQVKEEDATSQRAARSQDPQQSTQELQDYKHVCIGYSSYSTASASTFPHCEGIELVMEQPANPAHKQEAGSPTSPQQQQPVHEQRKHSQRGSAHPAPQHEPLVLHMHQQHTYAHQKSDKPQEGDGEHTYPAYFKFLAKATSNVAAMHKALKNEGPVKLKPLPKDLQEAQTRLMEQASKNSAKMATGLKHMANVAYTMTVKPLTDGLGITQRNHKS